MNDRIGKGDEAGPRRAVDRLPAANRLARHLAVSAAVAIAGCETQGTIVAHQAPKSPVRAVKVEPCQNRTDYSARDLGAEASRLLAEKIAASGVFAVSADAPFVLTCDVERFAEGNAAERWAAPGRGATQAQVAVVVWQQPGQQLLATLRGQGAVKTGGFYTIGADQYILGVAIDEIVRQLEKWAGIGR